MSSEELSIRTSGVTGGGFLKFLFYGSIAAFIILIIVLILHYTNFGLFSLNSVNGGIVYLPLSTNKNIAYETSIIPSYLSTRFSSVKQIRYTVSFDVFIFNTLPTGDNQVIFYNGKQIRDPSVQACGGGITTDCDPNLGKFLSKDSGQQSLYVTPTNLSSIQDALFQNNGNICMYLSPDKNDLNLMYYVAGSVWNTNTNPTIIGSTWVTDSVRIGGSPGGSPGGRWTFQYGPNCGSLGNIRSGDNKNECQSGSGSGYTSSGWVTTYGPTDKYQQTTPTSRDKKIITIENVPLNTPFRVTLAVDPNFIEIYINGNLVVTAKTPVGSELYVYPSDGKSEINFMGPPDFSPYCKVANIMYWNEVLPAKSIRLFSSTPTNKKYFEQS